MIFSFLLVKVGFPPLPTDSEVPHKYSSFPLTFTYVLSNLQELLVNLKWILVKSFSINQSLLTLFFAYKRLRSCIYSSSCPISNRFPSIIFPYTFLVIIKECIASVN